MLTGSTLVVVADGAIGRFLSRARPGAPGLATSRASRSSHAGSAWRPRKRPAPPRIHDRFGGRRHSVEDRQTAHEIAEEAFLGKVLERAVALMDTGLTDHLVLCAPPKALGILRGGLPAKAKEKLLASVAKDITKETPEAINQRMLDLQV